MRILKYKADAFDTDEAPTVCTSLETSLGLRLCVTDLSAPNNVHGYLNTGSDGEVEVHLYEQADCDAIEAVPDVVRFVKCDDCGRESNDWTDPDVCEGCGHDLDFSQGRARSLRSHKGIYKASNKADVEVRVAVERVLITERGMQRHLDNADGKPIRALHHTIDAQARALTKLERRASALLKRAQRGA